MPISDVNLPSFVECCFALNAGSAFYIGLKAFIEKTVESTFSSYEVGAVTSEATDLLEKRHRQEFSEKVSIRKNKHESRQKATYGTFRVFAGIAALASMIFLYLDFIHSWSSALLLLPPFLYLVVASLIYLHARGKLKRLYNSYKEVATPARTAEITEDQVEAFLKQISRGRLR